MSVFQCKNQYQVRSECLSCTFRASCCNARLSRALVPVFFAGYSVRDREKKRDGGGAAYTGEYKGVQADGGWFSVMEIRMSRRIKTKRNMCAFQ